jgi:hypothetical protein
MSKGRCPRELYGVSPQAQANIPFHGTLGQGIFYLKPQAHSFHGLFGTWWLRVMGLGQNVLKVPRGLDVIIHPPIG